MNLGGWFFCRDRESQSLLDASMESGGHVIPLDDANLLFSVGDLVFISEADGSELEFLGGVREVDADSMECALPARTTKAAGAHFWKAMASIHVAAESAQPLARKIVSGVSLERALSGTHYAIRTAATRETLDLKLDGMTTQRERSLHEWLKVQTQGGLLPFTLVAPERRVLAVRFDAGALERAERDVTRASVRLPLVIESEGGYS